MTIRPGRKAVERASAILLAGALAGCGTHLVPDPASPARAGSASPGATPEGTEAPPLEVLILVGTPGHMRLAWLAGDRERPIPLPDADVRWVSGSADRGLVATAGPAGRIFVSDPFAAGAPPTWREIAVDPVGRRWLGQPLADAVPDPAGDAIATVAADPASGFADGHLVLLDRSGGPDHAIVLAGRWDGRAPAWLDGGRVAVSMRDASDATALAIVDPAAGTSRSWGGAIGAYATSADGGTLAWQDRDSRRLVVGPLDLVLAGGATDTAPIDPATRLAAQLLLDATGRRLAVAWLDDAGDTSAYSVYERGARGWALLRAATLPRGTSRAVLVSLGP